MFWASVALCEAQPPIGIERKFEAVTHFEAAELPLEFRDLIEKAGHVFWINQLDRNESARDVWVGSNIWGKLKIFIKTPRGKRCLINAPYAKQEQLAFMISHKLKLNVVPPAMSLGGYKMPDAFNSNLCGFWGEGSVLQEAVDLHLDQIHNKGGGSVQILLIKTLTLT